MVFWRRRRVLRGADINGNREDIGNRRDGVGPRLMIPELLPRGAMPGCGRRTAGRASRLGYTGNCWIGWAIDHWKPSPLRRDFAHSGSQYPDPDQAPHTLIDA